MKRPEPSVEDTARPRSWWPPPAVTAASCVNRSGAPPANDSTVTPAIAAGRRSLSLMNCARASHGWELGKRDMSPSFFTYLHSTLSAPMQCTRLDVPLLSALAPPAPPWRSHNPHKPISSSKSLQTSVTQSHKCIQHNLLKQTKA